MIDKCFCEVIFFNDLKKNKKYQLDQSRDNILNISSDFILKLSTSVSNLYSIARQRIVKLQVLFYNNRV